MSSLPTGLDRLQAALSSSDTLRRFVSLASWSLVSFALEKGAMIVVIFMLARMLGAEDYGRFTLTQGLVNTLQIFIVLGVGTVLGRYIPKMLEESVQRAVEIINLCALVVLGAGAIVIVAGLIGARLIATEVLDLPLGSFAPYWMLAWICLSAINSLLLATMLSFEKGRVLGLVSLLGALLTTISVPTLANSLGLLGAIIAITAVEFAKALATSAIYIQMIKRAGLKVLSPISPSDVSLLYKFGLPTLITSLVWPTTMWLSQLIVKSYSPNGLAEVGALGIALNLLGLVVSISSLTNRAAFPILSSLEARGAHDELKRLSGSMALAQALAAAAIGLPLALSAPFIMTRLGSDFSSQWPVLMVIIGVGVTTASMTALGNYLLIVGRAPLIMTTMVAWGVGVLGGTALSHTHGAMGFAVSIFIVTLARLIAIIAAYVTPPSADTRPKHTTPESPGPAS